MKNNHLKCFPNLHFQCTSAWCLSQELVFHIDHFSWIWYKTKIICYQKNWYYLIRSLDIYKSCALWHPLCTCYFKSDSSCMRSTNNVAQFLCVCVWKAFYMIANPWMFKRWHAHTGLVVNNCDTLLLKYSIVMNFSFDGEVRY